MLNVLVPMAIAAIAGAGFLLTRGKANIGDMVEFYYTVSAPGVGTQRLILQGRIVDKTNPIAGPYYTVQLFQAPKLAPEFEFITNTIQSTIHGITDKDILRKLPK